jgi:hypothetical protein
MGGDVEVSSIYCSCGRPTVCHPMPDGSIEFWCTAHNPVVVVAIAVPRDE